MKDTDWVNQVIEEVVSGKHYKRLIQTGIDHLPNKKLYKYYSFASEYTVENLENGIIYLQNPNEFNDPFDCNIGISMNQIIQMVMPNFLSLVFPNMSDEARSFVGKWLFSDTVPDIAEGSKEQVLSICADSPMFLELIDKSNRGEMVSDDEIINFVMNDIDACYNLVKYYFSLIQREKEIYFSDTDIQSIMNYPQIIRNLINNCGVINNASEKELLDCFASQDDFFAKIDKLASLYGFEIPLEDISQAYAKLDDMIKQLRKNLGEKVGIECFTQSPTDVLMWSYYANKHTGICVEYDFSKMFSTVPDTFLFPVNYSDKRPLLNIDKMFDPVTQQSIKDQMPGEIPNLIRSFITKSKVWEREQEWRIISGNIKKQSDRKVILPIISKIITGINISEENYQKAVKIAQLRHVPIYRARLKNDQYIIEIIETEE